MAQESRSWEELWQEMQSEEDADGVEGTQEDDYERLSQLARSPLEINSGSREQLEQLPFLSAIQVMDILEYLHRYGPMRSLGELPMIRSLDYRQQALLPYFVYVADESASVLPDTSVHIRLHHPHTELTFTGRVPFQERRDDRADYLGYRYRHSFRAEFSAGEQLRVGLTGSQDAGEPFFSHGNSWGYDNYTYYVQLRRFGVLDQAIVGKYRLSAGMGLVFGNSFRLSKLASLMSLGRHPTTLRPQSSRSQADYFRGAAASVRLLGAEASAGALLKLTAFASYRPMDATLADDGSATTLVTSGYHRTVSEMSRKDNTHLTAFGGRLSFRYQGFRLGLNIVNSHLDRQLQPPETSLYRRHAPSGTDFLNVGLDYSLTRPRMTLSGETAVNRQGAVATVNTLGWQPSSAISVMALHRYYSYRYTGLYSHSFGNNSSSQNEQGIFLGTTYIPIANMTILAYADYAYFPWAKYLVSDSSHALDFLLQTEYRLPKWLLAVRVRTRLRERDNESKTALTYNNDYRLRLSATYDNSQQLSLRTQFDASRTFYQQPSRGWMVSERLLWQPPSWLLSVTAALFRTDDYASRLYLYERQMAHEYYMPSYYGRGFHLALLARKDFGKSFRLSVRLSYTGRSDRPETGTAQQQTEGSHQTSLDLQVRWRL